MFRSFLLHIRQRRRPRFAATASTSADHRGKQQALSRTLVVLIVYTSLEGPD